MTERRDSFQVSSHPSPRPKWPGDPGAMVEGCYVVTDDVVHAHRPTRQPRKGPARQAVHPEARERRQSQRLSLPD